MTDFTLKPIFNSYQFKCSQYRPKLKQICKKTQTKNANTHTQLKLQNRSNIQHPTKCEQNTYTRSDFGQHMQKGYLYFNTNQLFVTVRLTSFVL